MTHDAAAHDPGTPSGRVEIADSAIISIIHEAVLSCYGIVDMAPRSLGSAIVKRLGIGSTARGIGIQANDGHLFIELSVVVEYGTPIFTVAQNVMQTVKFQVERVLGMTVDRVNVNVDGLRVSNPAGSAP
ncbi:MAG TPA: Asp23/Gls24 family envelope stress response protein [Thermomicrobiales bacterium]|nr:Asp23/Gls24 family envelope stress response protein [Thermomicrobiales bacterium]